MLDHRNFDAPEPEQAPDALERADHRMEAVGVFTEQALGAPNGLRRGHSRGEWQKAARKERKPVALPLSA
jgi:uncharacterized protein YcaQ